MEAKWLKTSAEKDINTTFASNVDILSSLEAFIWSAAEEVVIVAAVAWGH